MNTKRFALAWVAACCAVSSFGQSSDALDETLELVGLRRADLGWRPKGWWPRFPADIPHKLRAFDALFAEPLDTITFTRALAQSARTHLDPKTINTRPPRWGTHLFQAVHTLGIDPIYGGLRGYTANVIKTDSPLDEAIIALHRAAGRPTTFITFDTESPYPQFKRDLAEKIKVIPQKARPVLGRLVMNVIDAHRWAELAFRNIDMKKRLAASLRLNLGAEQTDALDFSPDVDDVARFWDPASLWYAGEKCVQALDEARLDLIDIGDAPPFSFDWETPWGWIRIRGGGNDQIDGDDALLIIDFAGDDTYTGPVAASSAQQSISLLLDLSGDDRYVSKNRPAQGAGICGVGILIDAKGADVYEAERYAQGVGQFGLGVCADLDGKDKYTVHYSGQGCGYFGSGLLLDCAGDDEYTLYADGQGLGGVGGVGILADRSGDDRYTAVRDSTITGRSSYHSAEENITVSNAQGCAMGRRGDGADGHSWAGGLGALLDAEGNDRYEAGNWSMGTAYWFGIGLLHDGGGDDEYHGVVWSQASGAHFCIGVLIDEAGDDLHAAELTSNNSLAFAHDFTIAILLNIGGNDRYETKNNGLGYSINRSVAALIDIGGDDTYRGKQGNRPGIAIFDQRFRARDGVGTYFSDTTSLGLFLDVGGNDSYWSAQKNNSTWLDPQDSPNRPERNFSIGVDRATGEVGFRPRPEKQPTGGR